MMNIELVLGLVLIMASTGLSVAMFMYMTRDNKDYSNKASNLSNTIVRNNYISNLNNLSITYVGSDMVTEVPVLNAIWIKVRDNNSGEIFYSRVRG